MRPVLVTLGGVEVRSYLAFALVAFALAWTIRRREVRRLGAAAPHPWLAPAALLGAIVGSQVGMLLFLDPRTHGIPFLQGKTVLGALAGGILAVEAAKKLLGITVRTGDAFAIATAVGLAVGRIGCWLDGCCHGRFAVQLVEAALLAALAVGLALGRRRLTIPGHLWRVFLVGYALIRLGTEYLRQDPAVHLGPLRAAQVVCLLGALGFGWTLVRESPRLHPRGDR